MRWLAIACGAMSVVLWSLFSRVSHLLGLCPPLLAGLRDGLGVLFFSMAALGSLCISLSVFLSARKSNSWSTEGNFVFWGGAFLSVVFLVSALQFIVVGKWHLINPIIYLGFKWVLFGWVLGYLVWTLVYCRRFRKQSSRPSRG